MSDADFRTNMRDAVRDAMPVLLAVFPFGAVFGALAAEFGLSLWHVILISATLFAGASQYAMLDLMGQQVPAWTIVLTVFAINFRHILYSASISRHLARFSGLQKVMAFFLLTDLQFATGEARAARLVLRPAYYFTYAMIVYVVWLAANVVGALFGALLENPADYGIDFILPLYFAGLVFGFHKRPNFLSILAIGTAVSLLVFFTLGSPWHISLGGLAGVFAAAIISRPKEGVPVG